MDRGGARRWFFAAQAALIALVALAFLPVVGGEFLNWDDDVYVTENPLVTDRSPGQVRRILTTFLSGNYHPLAVASHALDNRLFGLEPRPHHGVNLALHLLNALLLHRLAFSAPFPTGFERRSIQPSIRTPA